MNIFFTSENPQLAAQSLHNRHCVKMILESCQILCTTHHELNTGKQHTTEVKFYRATHKNHPCCKWARECQNNYIWLSEHAIALCEEFEYRFGKKHASEPTAIYCQKNVPNIKILPTFTFPALCMPDVYKSTDPVQSYINYYINEKVFDKNGKRMDTYSKRERPGFWNEKR